MQAIVQRSYDTTNEEYVFGLLWKVVDGRSKAVRLITTCECIVGDCQLLMHAYLITILSHHTSFPVDMMHITTSAFTTHRNISIRKADFIFQEQWLDHVTKVLAKWTYKGYNRMSTSHGNHQLQERSSPSKQECSHKNREDYVIEWWQVFYCRGYETFSWYQDISTHHQNYVLDIQIRLSRRHTLAVFISHLLVIFFTLIKYTICFIYYSSLLLIALLFQQLQLASSITSYNQH